LAIPALLLIFLLLFVIIRRSQITKYKLIRTLRSPFTQFLTWPDLAEYDPVQPILNELPTWKVSAILYGAGLECVIWGATIIQAVERNVVIEVWGDIANTFMWVRNTCVRAR
jgi:hypothetical protein